MELLVDNKRELTKSIILLLREFEDLNGISVDFISIRNKPFVDKDGNTITAREVKTYYTENV